MNINPITNELRSKIIEKFQHILPRLQLNATAEAIENTCFEKADNNAESYIKICQNFIATRNKYIDNRNSQMQNFRPNVVGSSNNGIASDPINALQNLTVTAGQQNQINMQQINQQQQNNNNNQQQQQMSIRMINNNNNINNNNQSNMYNQQIHSQQRNMVPVNIQTPNMQRQPMEQQFPMTQSPTTQINQPQQMQQVHTINMVNTNNIRLINKNVITQSPVIPVTYQMDNNNVRTIYRAQMTPQQQQQHMSNMTQVRPQIVRMVANSPSVVPITINNNININNNQQMSLQQAQQEQFSNLKANNVSSNNIIQPEESNTQTMHRSQSNGSLSSNANPTNVAVVNNSNSSSSQPPPSVPPVKVPVSEEEAQKVREELSRLSEMYLRYIKLALKNSELINAEQMKIWVTLAGVLEDPKALNRNISLKHVTRIQEFCEKAEKLVQHHNLDKPKPIALPKSEELFGKRVIPERIRSLASVNAVAAASEQNLGVIDISSSINNNNNNVNNSLDVAFDDVIHQLKKKDSKIMRKIQRNLVKHVKKNKQLIRYLPKSIQNQEEDNSDNDISYNKVDATYDEHEFDNFFDNIVIEGYSSLPISKGRHRALDHLGLLRTDIIDSSESPLSQFTDIGSDAELVKQEFLIVPLNNNNNNSIYNTSLKWLLESVEETETKEESLYFSVSYRGHLLSSKVPPLVLRVPRDYEEGGSIDCAINIDLYVDCDDKYRLFLQDVREAVEYEFGDLAGGCRRNIGGVTLLLALAVYKRSFETGLSNYECRRAITSNSDREMYY